MSTFSERLVLLRNEKKITQEKFAEIIGVSKSTISMYENGNRTPSFEIEEKIADYFNVDLEFLRGRSNIRNRYQHNKLKSESNVTPVNSPIYKYDFKLSNGEVGEIKIKKGKIHVFIGMPEDPNSFKEVDFNDEKNFKLKNALQLLEFSIKDIKITSKIKTDLERAVASIFSENYTLNTSKINEGINQELPSLKYAYEGDSEAHNENIKLKLIKSRHRKEKYEKK